MTPIPAKEALITTIAELPQQAGRKLGPTEWRSMSQEQVNQFADVTDDHNSIHVDPVRARESPFGGTIAHGYLTLSLLGPLSQELIVVRDAATSINYGLNKVRFPAPLRVGAEYRATGEVIEVTAVTGGVQVTAAFSVEVRGTTKPALAAECLLRYYR
jgi:acyl dehydratase